MKPTQDRILWLLTRYANRSATEAELTELTNWMASTEDQEPFETYLTGLLDQNAQKQFNDEPAWDLMYEKIRAGRTMLGEESTSAPVRHIRKRWLVAASIIALLGIGAWIWSYNQKQDTSIISPAGTAQTIPAGKDGAVLTLADGTQIVLDSLGNGVIASESGVQVILANGQLNYEADNNSHAAAFNSMSTPKGRQFRLQLPDGTKVWLNAASSIRYPVKFEGNERRVEIKGEVYFEVAPNKNKPFFVKAGDLTEVKVLGTSFNINAYDNEEIKSTTLLDGSVIVTSLENGKPKLSMPLHPGQQMQQRDAQMTMNTRPNLDKVMAWKNGQFYFEGVPLEEMMRQLERWYNIEVKYEGKIPDMQGYGKASRTLDLATVLTSLKGFGLNFRIENNRTLIITP